MSIILEWRNGLVYAMQQVLDSLPRSTKIAVRTKNRAHNIIFPPSEFSIMEMDIRAHELTHIVCMSAILGTSKAVKRQHITGGDGGFMPWMSLFLGKPTSADPDKDARVVLDLACTMLGGRGPAGEIFALQRGKEYLDETLAKVADDLGGEMKLSGRTVHRRNDREELGRLAAAVVERIRRVVVDGVPFCAHCGSPDATMRCSRCKKVHFCSKEHQVGGWSFHKIYCERSD